MNLNSKLLKEIVYITFKTNYQCYITIQIEDLYCRVSKMVLRI